MNRFLRRMQRFGKHRSQGETTDKERDRIRSDAPPEQDVSSVRAKSAGHGKKTADKWNQ